MLANGASDDDVAKLIRDNNVKIVLISHEERERLDRQAQVGLKQVMPPNWKFGDDIFARLKAAEIVWDSIEPAA